MPPELVEALMDRPEPVVPVKHGRVAYQSGVEVEGRTYLPRAIVRDDLSPPVLVTVYRTSRVSKYWTEV